MARFDLYENGVPDGPTDELIFWDASDGKVKNVTRAQLETVFARTTHQHTPADSISTQKAGTTPQHLVTLYNPAAGSPGDPDAYGNYPITEIMNLSKASPLTIFDHNPTAEELAALPLWVFYVVQINAPSAPVLAYVSNAVGSITFSLTTASTDVEDGTITTYEIYRNGVKFGADLTGWAQGANKTLTGVAEGSASWTIKGKDSADNLGSASNAVAAEPYTAWTTLFNADMQTAPSGVTYFARNVTDTDRGTSTGNAQRMRVTPTAPQSGSRYLRQISKFTASTSADALAGIESTLFTQAFWRVTAGVLYESLTASIIRHPTNGDKLQLGSGSFRNTAVLDGSYTPGMFVAGTTYRAEMVLDKVGASVTISVYNDATSDLVATLTAALDKDLATLAAWVPTRTDHSWPATNTSCTLAYSSGNKRVESLWGNDTTVAYTLATTNVLSHNVAES